MGVLPCSRFGCENIMCDRYSILYGYLCEECFNEIVEANPENIDLFLSLPRQPKQREGVSFYTFFDNLFPKK